MVVKDEKGNEKNGPMHKERSNPTQISITEDSTRAVLNQHGPVLNHLQKKRPVQVTGHGPCSPDTPPCPGFCFFSLIFVTGT